MPSSFPQTTIVTLGFITWLQWLYDRLGLVRLKPRLETKRDSWIHQECPENLKYVWSGLGEWLVVNWGMGVMIWCACVYTVFPFGDQSQTEMWPIWWPLLNCSFDTVIRVLIFEVGSYGLLVDRCSLSLQMMISDAPVLHWAFSGEPTLITLRGSLFHCV